MNLIFRHSKIVLFSKTYFIYQLMQLLRFAVTYTYAVEQTILVLGVRKIVNISDQMFLEKNIMVLMFIIQIRWK